MIDSCSVAGQKFTSRFMCVCRLHTLIALFCRNQSQVTLLSPNQSVLYTWDDPTHERTLMWNVYNRKKPSYPAFISKVTNRVLVRKQEIQFQEEEIASIHEPLELLDLYFDLDDRGVFSRFRTGTARCRCPFRRSAAAASCRRRRRAARSATTNSARRTAASASTAAKMVRVPWMLK